MRTGALTDVYDRPKDFRGHSMSVSDIVVLNDGKK